MRQSRWGAWSLVHLLFAGCASAPGPADIRAWSAQGETAKVADIFHRAPDSALRAEVLRVAAQQPEDPTYSGLLVEAAQTSASTKERSVAVEALATVDHPRAEGTLIDALGDAQPAVRGAARRAVARRAPRMQEGLRQAVGSHPNALVRAAAIQALVASVTPAQQSASEACLLRAAADAAPGVRKAAAAGLGRLGVVSARPLLVDLSRADPQREVRMAAQTALEQVGSQGGEKAVLAVLPLEVGGRDPSGELRALADQVAEVARARLSEHPLCEVIDRRRMETVLAELRKHGTMVYDGDALNAPAIGEFKIANQLVYGRISKRGPVYSVVLQRLDVSTLELVGGGSVTQTGYAGELDTLVSEVVDKFVRRFR